MVDWPRVCYKQIEKNPLLAVLTVAAAVAAVVAAAAAAEPYYSSWSDYGIHRGRRTPPQQWHPYRRKVHRWLN